MEKSEMTRNSKQQWYKIIILSIVLLLIGIDGDLLASEPASSNDARHRVFLPIGSGIVPSPDEQCEMSIDILDRGINMKKEYAISKDGFPIIMKKSLSASSQETSNEAWIYDKSRLTRYIYRSSNNTHSNNYRYDEKSRLTMWQLDNDNDNIIDDQCELGYSNTGDDYTTVYVCDWSLDNIIDELFVVDYIDDRVSSKIRINLMDNAIVWKKTYSYAENKLKAVISFDGRGNERNKLVITYDDDGNAIKETIFLDTEEHSNTYKRYHDGKITSRMEILVDGDELLRHERWAYDSRGRISSREVEAQFATISERYEYSDACGDTIVLDVAPDLF